MTLAVIAWCLRTNRSATWVSQASVSSGTRPLAYSRAWTGDITSSQRLKFARRALVRRSHSRTAGLSKALHRGATELLVKLTKNCLKNAIIVPSCFVRPAVIWRRSSYADQSRVALMKSKNQNSLDGWWYFWKRYAFFYFTFDFALHKSVSVGVGFLMSYVAEQEIKSIFLRHANARCPFITNSANIYCSLKRTQGTL